MKDAIFGASIILVLASLGCGGTDTGLAEGRTISALDLEALPVRQSLGIDLTPRDAMVRFDRSSGPIDMSRLGIITPKGEAMPLVIWLRRQASAQGIPENLFTARVISIENALRQPRDPDEEEDNACLACDESTDGAHVCEELCESGPSPQDDRDEQIAQWLRKCGWPYVSCGVEEAGAYVEARWFHPDWADQEDDEGGDGAPAGAGSGDEPSDWSYWNGGGGDSGGSGSDGGGGSQGGGGYAGGGSGEGW